MASPTTTLPARTLDRIAERFAYLEARMGEAAGGEIAELAREWSELRPVVERVGEWRALGRGLAEAEAMLGDPDMRPLAEAEIEALRARAPKLERELRLALLPRDAADARPAVVEIRPGTGGEEAALFAADLLRMYQRHAEARGWAWDVVSLAETEIGGVKEATMTVRGEGVFARLKWESGVHRVQRVPETESGGRVHTSAATVAVLPEAEEVDVAIDPADLRLDTMRASGAGGQHVNTTDSAVRITHLPTGLVVTSSEKSQHRNREIAMGVLRARLYDLQRREADESRAADRRSQVGTGDRSERVRTYNFPQGRVTDHRIGLTLHRLASVLAGDIDEITDALIERDQAERLAAQGA